MIELALKEKNVTEKIKREGDTERRASKTYKGETPEGVKVTLKLKGKEQDLAPFDETINVEL